jgi:hypothetical protein
VEWHHANLNRNKKIEAASSAGTVMATVFWDMQEFLFVDIIPKGIVFNPEAYVAAFMHVCALFCSRTIRGGTSVCGPRRPNVGGICCHTNFTFLTWHYQTTVFSVTGTKSEDDEFLVAAAEKSEV